MSFIPVLERQRQEDLTDVEASLVYKVGFSFRIQVILTQFGATQHKLEVSSRRNFS